MKKKIAIIALWLVCGFFNYGKSLGYFTHRFPEADHLGISLLLFATGPCGTLIEGVMAWPSHWLLKPYTTEQRWNVFHEKWPELPRSDFEEDYN